MAPLQRWCRATVVEPDGTVWGGVVLEGSGAPDLAAVDAVARLARRAARRGARLTLTEVSSAMRELLDLAALGVEVVGQPERGEQRRAVQGQERVDRRDLPA